MKTKYLASLGLIALAAACTSDTANEVVAKDRTAQSGNSVDVMTAKILKLAKSSGEDSKAQTHWNMGYYMGTTQGSMFYLTYVLLAERGLIHSSEIPIDPQELVDHMTDQQYPDGSWGDFYDPNLGTGDVTSTVVHYFALKVLEEKLGVGSSANKEKAAAFVRANGGIEKAAFMAKFFLGMFNAFPWEDVSAIPDFVIEFIDLNSFAQWIAPNFYPVAYIRKTELTVDMGVRVNELFAEGTPTLNNKGLDPRADNIPALLDRIFLDSQQPKGSWGGYFTSTLLSVLCLDYTRSYHPDPTVRQDIGTRIDRAFSFVRDGMTEATSSNVQGPPSFGQIWDTGLIGLALTDAQRARGQVPQSTLVEAGDFLASMQASSGGFPFGSDFGYMADADDTGVILTTLSRVDAKRYEQVIRRSILWLETLQNSDGGWPAFAKQSWFVRMLKHLPTGMMDSMAPVSFFLDPSSADVTGHVLEGLWTYHDTLQDDRSVGADDIRNRIERMTSDAVKYLKGNSTSFGAGKQGWYGKWGVNYIYGTSAAFVGLAKARELDSDTAREALAWLTSCQNQDGGFGETTNSYLDPELACKGVSTPSQTAWALLPFLEIGDVNNPVVVKGIAYLKEHTVSVEGPVKDDSITGVAHPGLNYMRYASYPYAFPLMALSRYEQLR